MDSKKLIAIVGPTSSGKTELAINIALKHNGEIICADSRTIYKGMDIGTAKPTAAEQEKVKHHCLDLVEPDEEFSAAQYKQAASQAISKIRKTRKLPILVGGSGLYVDSVLYNFSFDRKRALELRNMPLAQLQAKAAGLGLDVPEQIFLNPRHLAGYIEREGRPATRQANNDVLIMGIRPEKNVINERIKKRATQMLQDGFVQEVKNLLGKYNENSPGFLSPGYRPMIGYIKGELTLDEAKHRFIANDKKLARRQLAWFTRNKDIHWIASPHEAEQIIQEYLQ